jgi:glyoxylase-like metal-dependent hydrolase (beta-lactamase superfamily II)
MGVGMAKPRVSEVVSDVYVVRIGRGALSTNVYLIGSRSSFWTLVDAGWVGSEKKITAAAESVFGPGARPASMVLTHLHPDHSGATAQLAERWGQSAYVHPDELPLAAGYRQAYAIPLDRWLLPLIRRLPKKTQAKIATGADLTAVVQPFDPQAGIPGLPGWTAIHSPGHTPGHLSLYRPSDGVLITGDAVVTVDVTSLLGILTSRQGVFGPPRYSTWDRAEAQRSIATLAALEPRVLATGHGPVRIEETAQALHALAASHGVPARWRQGLFAGVDYSARSRYRPPPPLYQRVQKRLGPFLTSHGIGPKQVVVLEVPGRRSGIIRRNALVKASCEGNEYLVALAGESEWVRNVRAAHGQVVIGGRQRQAAQLVEVPPAERPPIIRAYLLRWGRQPNSPAVQHEARLFFGVSGDPSVEELAAIAEFYPVFRITHNQCARVMITQWDSSEAVGQRTLSCDH